MIRTKLPMAAWALALPRRLTTPASKFAATRSRCPIRFTSTRRRLDPGSLQPTQAGFAFRSCDFRRNARLFAATLAALLVVAAPGESAAGPPRPVLEIDPPVLVLDGAGAERQVLVTLVHPNGRRDDVTRKVTFHPAKPFTQTVGGRFRALRDGATTVRVRYAVSGTRAVETSLPLTVRNVRRERAVSLVNDVIPALTVAGCNQGACHGAQFGRGGFRLSLLGYAPEADFAALALEGGGRRVNRAAPAQSLLLLKGALSLPHGGGMRLVPRSPPWEILARWVAAGAPGPREAECTVTAIEVTPRERLLRRAETQQLRVTARYSDGTTQDVTHLALYTSGNDGVAAVSGEGTVKAAAPGAAPIMVRYQGLAAVARVLSPFRESAPGTTVAARPGSIDGWIEREWQRLGLSPSVSASDAEFLRRVSLDLTGTLPTPEEVEGFLAESRGTRPAERVREQWVDQLLRRSEWADFWALYFGDLLRNTRKTSGEKGLWAFHNWIRNSLRDGKPYNEMVRELIGSRGSAVRLGAANFYNAAKTPEDLAETTSQVLLGIRMQCARCHNHPFEKWTQADYYGLAAFFPGVKRKQSNTDLLVLHTAEGEVRHPRSGQVMAPRVLAGPELEVSGEARPRALADWLAAPENPYVARNIVNRVWARLMGRGLVEPVDDVRVSNPPTHPELLEGLTREFVAGGFDLRKLMRTIVTSRVYQLSSHPTAANERDDRFYSHYRARRLMAEQLVDAIGAATGKAEKFPGLPAGYRAISLPDPGTARMALLDTFGRPQRASTCECERSNRPNLTQTLFLINSDYVQARVSDEQGLVAELVRQEKSDAEIIRRLYLGTVSRPPKDEEISQAKRFLAEAESRREGAEDLLWTLLNSQEFLLQH